MRRVGIVVSDPYWGILYYPTRFAMWFQSQGLQVTAYSWTTQGQSPEYFADLQRAGIELVLKPSLASSAGPKGLLSGLKDHRTVRDLDVLYTYGPFSAWQLSGFGHRTPARVVTIVSAMGHSERSGAKERLGALALNRSADVAVALCALEAERLGRLGVDAQRTRIVFNPIDVGVFDAVRERAEGAGRDAVLSRFRLPHDKLLVACFSSFQSRKRHDIIVRSFEKLSQSRDDVHLVLVGEGPEQTRVRELVASLRLTSQVSFVGYLPYDQGLEALWGCDFVLHASNAETFGYAVVEPLLMGKPLLATRVGIGHEIDQLGLARVVKPDDQSAFDEELKALVAEPADPARTRDARAFVQNACSFEVVGEQLLRLAQPESM